MDTTTLTHGATPIAGIGSVVEQDKGGTKRYLHNDHRGTTYKITSDAGTEVWSGLTDAYGVELGETGTPDQSIFWYQGQAWYRHELGDQVLYVSPTRIYMPEDGRFAERDPIEKIGGMNYSMPTNPDWVDPSGLAVRLAGIGTPNVTIYFDMLFFLNQANSGTETTGRKEEARKERIRKQCDAAKAAVVRAIKLLNSERSAHLKRNKRFVQVGGCWYWKENPNLAWCKKKGSTVEFKLGKWKCDELPKAYRGGNIIADPKRNVRTRRPLSKLDFRNVGEAMIGSTTFGTIARRLEVDKAKLNVVFQYHDKQIKKKVESAPVFGIVDLRAGKPTQFRALLLGTSATSSTQKRHVRGAAHEFLHLAGLEDEYIVGRPDEVREDIEQYDHRNSNKIVTGRGGGIMIGKPNVFPRNIERALNFGKPHCTPSKAPKNG